MKQRINNRKPTTKKSNRSQKPLKPSQNQLYQELSVVRLPTDRLMRGPFPQSEIVKYNYVYTFQTSGAAPFTVIDFRLNSIYQPLVGGSSGTLAGYAGSAARYASYRVLDTSVRLDAANAEPSNVVHLGFLVNDTQPSTVITTYQQAQTALGSSKTFFRAQLGNSSGNSIYRSPTKRFSPGAVVGDPMMVMSDRDFASAFGANPNQTSWGSVLTVSDSSAVNLTNGAVITIVISYVVRNFGPLVLA